jgi:arylsulfatase A-like enzyme
MPADRPNVVYLHSHDTGRYISPYGYAVPTPNLQRFAEQGVTFRQAFCACPTCSPSRAALYTGRMPSQVGMFGLAHKGWSLHEPQNTIVGRFNDASYHTVLGGFQHVTTWGDDEGDRLGFAEQLPTNRKGGVERAEGAVEFLKRVPKDKPFYLDVGFGETHRSGWTDKTDGLEPQWHGRKVQWHTGESAPIGDARYVRPPATLPDDPVTRRDWADYLECARRLDSLHGYVLKTLDEAGLAENTIVVITTDHGVAFPRMKCNLTDHGTGVLLMMRGPEALGLRGGRVIDSLVGQTDLAATYDDWLGIGTPDSPGDTVGRSLAPLLRDEAKHAHPDAVHEAVFGEVTYHGKQEVERTVRTPRYRYIRRFQPEPIDRHSCDGGVSREVLLDAGWEDTPLPEEQLYDVLFDPTQANNLADRGTHDAVVADLRAKLEARMRATGDPVLTGDIPQPAEAAA